MAKADRYEQTSLTYALAHNYERLSVSQRLVIERMLSDARYAVIVSASELARQVGVSESTVTQAAQRLGFVGYRDLQAHVRKQLFAPLSRRVEIKACQSAEAAEAAAIQGIIEEAESVRQTAEHLAPETLRHAIEMLVTARRVFVFGSRGSYGLAQMLAIGLRILVNDIRVLSEDAGTLADELVTLKPDDVLIAISLPRVDRITVRAVNHAVTAGTTVIAISDALYGPVGRKANLTLTVRLGPLRLVPAYASGASIINALIVAGSQRTSDNAATRPSAAERVGEHHSSP